MHTDIYSYYFLLCKLQDIRCNKTYKNKKSQCLKVSVDVNWVFYIDLLHVIHPVHVTGDALTELSLFIYLILLQHTHNLFFPSLHIYKY